MSKSDMLSTIRKALNGDPDRASRPADLNALPALGRVLPTIEQADLVSRFEQELDRVGASAHRVMTRSGVRELLGRILEGDRASGVVLSRNPLLDRLDLGSILGGLGIPAWSWPATPNLAGGQKGDPAAPGSPTYRDRCFSAAAGITGVEFVLAESGSLVLTSAAEGAQLSSLAPPIHIAFYLRSQVVGALEDVLEGLASFGAGSPELDGRSIVMITGTSRTADIEQILIRGVHGPRELHAILVEESCLTAAD
jgi:L-lactate dehydrogenase complex protein LldG